MRVCKVRNVVHATQEEKKIPYTIEKINMRCYGDKPDSFLAKVPRGLLPVLELDGSVVVTESADIMDVLEREFPETPMMPRGGTPEHKHVLPPPIASLCPSLHVVALGFCTDVVLALYSGVWMST